MDLGPLKFRVSLRRIKHAALKRPPWRQAPFCDLKAVLIDLPASHFWDITSINALDRVVFKFRHRGIKVKIIGMNEATATMVERLSTHGKEGAVVTAPGHS